MRAAKRLAGRGARARALAVCALLAAGVLALAASASVPRNLQRGGLSRSASTNREHSSHVTFGGGAAQTVEATARGAGEASAAAGFVFAAAPSAALFAPFFQAAPVESVATYAENCTTPQTSFSIGDTVCARVTTPYSNRRLIWAGATGAQSGAPGSSVSLGAGAADATFTFTLPDDAASRGGWRVVIVDADFATRAAARFSVSDPQDALADLSVLTTPAVGETSVPAGAQVSYLIFVENLGPDNAANVQLTTDVPDNTTFFSLTQNSGPSFNCVNPSVGTGPSGTSVCSIASLPVGAKAVFTAVYDVGGGTAPGTEIVNTATVTSATNESHTPDNESSASFFVSQVPACVITTPADVTVDNAPGQGGAVVNYGAATGSTACGPITCDPPSNTFFPVGTTFVTCSNANLTVLERFMVTVNDTQTPQITCPANISVSEDAGTPGEAAVNFPAPTVVDNDPNAQVTFSPLSGSTFTVAGSPHTVTATATDISGNSASCTFTVTVTPGPQTCTLTPNVATLPTVTGQCAVTVSTIPTATSSCGGQIGATTNDPRFYDEPGTYTIHWTYTDAGGNTAMQDQTVIVTAGSGALSVTGPPSVQVHNPLGATSCGVEIEDLGAVLNLSVSGSCANYDITHAVTPPAPGNVFNVGTAYTVVTTVTDGSTSSSVTQTLHVIDDTPPTITAPANATYQCASQVPAASPSQATAADNCGTPTVTVSETNNGGVGSTASPLVITRTYTATDESGRTATAAQTITLIDNTPPTITAPASVSAQTGPGAVSCSAFVSDATLGSATATDNCASVNVTRTGVPAGNNFPVGTTTVTYTATDAVGNTATATQVVTVTDNTQPVITLVGANPLAWECHTAFVDPGATATDNCAGNLTGSISATGTVNTNVPGTYTRTYTVSDGNGNSTTVTRTVNVVDTTAPTISCPSNVVVTLPPNSTATSMPVSFPAPTVGDSCDSTPTVTLTKASGSTFNVGTTTVTATVTDDAGNSASCSFTVTVLYNFTGFFSPVSNLPAINNVNAGRSIPLKFSLSGNKGLGIFAADYPASQQIACNSSAPLSELEGTETPGGSTLTYSPDQYHYNWKTEKAWEGTCRILVVKLNDGSEHTALFKFK